MLILLDLSSAFDTISHDLLLTNMRSIGITGSALSWFSSYLMDRRQYIAIQNNKSSMVSVTKGVPQGSVLGPLLFTIYMLPLGQIIRLHGLSFHCYADDTQIYVSVSPVQTTPPPALSDCIHDIKSWISLNFLKLNAAILMGFQ